MRRIMVIFVLLLASFAAMAQSVFSTFETDTLTVSVPVQRGVGYVNADRNFTDAVSQVFSALDESGSELVRVIVSGSSSPDGLWGYNIALSKARTDNAADYIRSVMKVPSYQIQKVDLMEDWAGLEKMIAASDLRQKDEVADIIRNKTWGERKTALKEIDGGTVWSILEDHFFPKMRCVSISLVCKGKIETRDFVKETCRVQVDTVFIRDTVYIKDTVYVCKDLAPDVVESSSEEKETQKTQGLPQEPVSPWMMGVKTNLLYDAMALYNLGLEIQLARHLSLDYQVYGSNFNIFFPEDRGARVFGMSPELRWWFGDGIMRKGIFIGAYADLSWYSIRWKDGMLYQTGSMESWASRDFDLTSAPAWSAGLSCGYSLGLGRKQRWGLEFVVGAGYFSIQHNIAAKDIQQEWVLKENKKMSGFSLTKAEVNLTYRFSIR